MTSPALQRGPTSPYDLHPWTNPRPQPDRRPISVGETSDAPGADASPARSGSQTDTLPHPN